MKSLRITAAVFFGICFLYILIMLSQTENNFTYILDDAYIHLAMAKNFALHGVWGVTEYAFSSSSSSPFFTFILSGLIFIFGDYQLIPLIFNLGCSFLIVYFLNRYYSDFFKLNRSVILACIFTLLFASVHLLVFSGMEHVLQVLIVVINVCSFEKWRRSDFKNSLYSGWFYGSIALLGLIRFESMFYFLALAFVFLLLKKFKQSAVLLLFGFLPVLIFGYLTYQKTGYFFPNSVMVKGTKFDLAGNYFIQIKNILLFKILLRPYFYFAGLLPLCFAAFLIFKDYKKKLDFHPVILNNFLPVALSIALFIQGALGQYTNFYRYEAYLLAAFAMVVIPKIKDLFINRHFLLKANRITALLVLLTSMVLVLKMVLVSILIVTGSRNVYEQQIQSARFLEKYYNNSKVAANDIGAVCYFTDIHLLDVAGLGSKEVVPFKIKKKGLNDQFEFFLKDYTTQNHYDLAIVYEEWLEGHIPENWKKAAVLEIKGWNAVLGLKKVTVYSINPDLHESLKQNVKNFQWNKNVTVRMAE
ncbi:hypothetical protein JET18_14625 [Chryseobacterium sp. L7]|uniref:Glycosyltransferase RgtA/B/C/D-like domain-containing protein n=1 Tax=Chryseobacterium endalhagicum TaxID=2797638 RepID=A0ABS1QHL0_9FLAO|nr:hypothetical protein [Chryseobacterium endalhagicum]MBL1222083.1 hypothetical protein [Chryseobacterium endalhagicum]